MTYFPFKWYIVENQYNLHFFGGTKACLMHKKAIYLHFESSYNVLVTSKKDSTGFDEDYVLSERNVCFPAVYHSSLISSFAKNVFNHFLQNINHSALTCYLYRLDTL